MKQNSIIETSKNGWVYEIRNSCYAQIVDLRNENGLDTSGELKIRQRAVYVFYWLIYWFLPFWFFLTLVAVLFDARLWKLTFAKLRFAISNKRKQTRESFFASQTTESHILTLLSLVTIIYGFAESAKLRFANDQFWRYFFQKNLPGMIASQQDLSWETFYHIKYKDFITDKDLDQMNFSNDSIQLNLNLLWQKKQNQLYIGEFNDAHQPSKWYFLPAHHYEEASLGLSTVKKEAPSYCESKIRKQPLASNESSIRNRFIWALSPTLSTIKKELCSDLRTFSLWSGFTRRVRSSFDSSSPVASDTADLRFVNKEKAVSNFDDLPQKIESIYPSLLTSEVYTPKNRSEKSESKLSNSVRATGVHLKQPVVPSPKGLSGNLTVDNQNTLLKLKNNSPGGESLNTLDGNEILNNAPIEARSTAKAPKVVLYCAKGRVMSSTVLEQPALRNADRFVSIDCPTRESTTFGPTQNYVDRYLASKALNSEGLMREGLVTNEVTIKGKDLPELCSGQLPERSSDQLTRRSDFNVPKDENVLKDEVHLNLHGVQAEGKVQAKAVPSIGTPIELKPSLNCSNLSFLQNYEVATEAKLVDRLRKTQYLSSRSYEENGLGQSRTSLRGQNISPPNINQDKPYNQLQNEFKQTLYQQGLNLFVPGFINDSGSKNGEAKLRHNLNNIQEEQSSTAALNPTLSPNLLKKKGRPTKVRPLATTFGTCNVERLKARRTAKPVRSTRISRESATFGF